MRLLVYSCVWLLAAALAGCAGRAPVTPRTLAPMEQPTADVILTGDAHVRLTTGRTALLSQGSRWRAVGALPEGLVYQPVGTVYMIVGRDTHEAYLVLQGNALQGFFLPGEGNYSPLPVAPLIPVTKGEVR